MNEANHYAPVILYSEDIKEVYLALLSAGRVELAQKILRKSNRSRLDEMYIEHAVADHSDDFNHDEEPVVSQCSNGAFVMLWKWVYKDEIRQALKNTKNSQKVA